MAIRTQLLEPKTTAETYPMVLNLLKTSSKWVPMQSQAPSMEETLAELEKRESIYGETNLWKERVNLHILLRDRQS